MYEYKTNINSIIGKIKQMPEYEDISAYESNLEDILKDKMDDENLDWIKKAYAVAKGHLSVIAKCQQRLEKSEELSSYLKDLEESYRELDEQGD